MAGARQDQLSQEGQHAQGKLWGQIFSEGFSIQVERNTPSHCLSLGGPGSDRLGLSTGLSQPGSLGVLVTTAEWR